MSEPEASVLRSSLYPLRSMRRLERVLDVPRDELRRLADGIDDRYRPFEIPKANGDSRRIDNPSPDLKRVQRLINTRILPTVPLPSTMLGAVRGSSIVRNSNVHVRAPVVVKLDLRKCFESTRFERVFHVFKTYFGCSDRIAVLLTRLTTFEGHLPQGAPTSSRLAHLTLLPLHQVVEGIARCYGVAYSMWVDDITLSGARARAARTAVEHAIRGHGYRVSKGKSQELLNWRDKQEVTGVVVNRTVSIARAKREEIRREVRRLSLAGASERDLARVAGLVSHVAQVNPEQGKRLEALVRRILPGPLVDAEGVE